MYKETVICLITIILIISINYFTDSYTKESFLQLTDVLLELKKETTEENIKSKRNKVDDIYKIWESKYNVLAYYIEHDELEKAQINMTSLKSAVESGEYSDAMHELDEMVFILHHIEEKNNFDLKNIF